MEIYKKLSATSLFIITLVLVHTAVIGQDRDTPNGLGLTTFQNDTIVSISVIHSSRGWSAKINNLALGEPTKNIVQDREFKVAMLAGNKERLYVISIDDPRKIYVEADEDKPADIELLDEGSFYVFFPYNLEAEALQILENTPEGEESITVIPISEELRAARQAFQEN